MTRLLIVGIDPGTTAAFAALDLEGNLVGKGSGKHLDADTLVARLAELGRPLAVGTDKAKTPALVGVIATRFGARLVAPAEDILVADKRVLVASGYANAHEMDALAAARFAFKKTAPLLERVKRAAKEHPALVEPLAELVVKKGISIKAAMTLLTRPELPETKILRPVHEQRALNEKDYWKLYDELVAGREALALVQKQNRKLLNLARKLKQKVRSLKQAVKPETRIIRPTAELESARKTIAGLQDQLARVLSRQHRLQHAVLNPEAYVVAKRLRNLGIAEYRRAARMLGFRKNDVLFVEDPNQFSPRVLDELRDVVELVVAVRLPAPKVAERLPFVVLDASGIAHVQDDQLAFLDRKAFVQACADRELLRNLVREYQAKRSAR